MNSEPNIRQALIDYILRHDPAYPQEKLVSRTILELIVLKTEIELHGVRSKTAIP